MEKVKLINRVYPNIGWDFKAVKIRTVNASNHPVDLVYGIVIDKGKKYESFEMYTGVNYIVGSENRSYSRSSKDILHVPKIYIDQFKKLKEIHSSIDWSIEGLTP